MKGAVNNFTPEMKAENLRFVAYALGAWFFWYALRRGKDRY